MSSRRPVSALLSAYYNLSDPSSLSSSSSSSSCTTPLEEPIVTSSSVLSCSSCSSSCLSSYSLDSPDFDVHVYFNSLMESTSLPSFLSLSNELADQTRQLDSDMQMLVYENYSKFLSAMDTIRKIRKDVEGMEKEMVRVEDAMQSIEKCEKDIHSILSLRNSKIQELYSLNQLLVDIKLIASLPTIMYHSLLRNNFDEVIRLYLLSYPFLNHPNNTTATTSGGGPNQFHFIRHQCASLLQVARDRLRDTVYHSSFSTTTTEFFSSDSTRKHLATTPRVRKIIASCSLLLSCGEPPHDVLALFLHAARRELISAAELIFAPEYPLAERWQDHGNNHDENNNNNKKKKQQQQQQQQEEEDKEGNATEQKEMGEEHKDDLFGLHGFTFISFKTCCDRMSSHFVDILVEIYHGMSQLYQQPTTIVNSSMTTTTTGSLTSVYSSTVFTSTQSDFISQNLDMIFFSTLHALSLYPPVHDVFISSLNGLLRDFQPLLLLAGCAHLAAPVHAFEDAARRTFAAAQFASLFGATDDALARLHRLCVETCPGPFASPEAVPGRLPPGLAEELIQFEHWLFLHVSTTLKDCAVIVAGTPSHPQPTTLTPATHGADIAVFCELLIEIFVGSAARIAEGAPGTCIQTLENNMHGKTENEPNDDLTVNVYDSPLITLPNSFFSKNTTTDHTPIVISASTATSASTMATNSTPISTRRQMGSLLPSSCPPVTLFCLPFRDYLTAEFPSPLMQLCFVRLLNCLENKLLQKIDLVARDFFGDLPVHMFTQGIHIAGYYQNTDSTCPRSSSSAISSIKNQSFSTNGRPAAVRVGLAASSCLLSFLYDVGCCLSSSLRHSVEVPDWAIGGAPDDVRRVIEDTLHALLRAERLLTYALGGAAAPATRAGPGGPAAARDDHQRRMARIFGGRARTEVERQMERLLARRVPVYAAVTVQEPGARTNAGPAPLFQSVGACFTYITRLIIRNLIEYVRQESLNIHGIQQIQIDSAFLLEIVKEMVEGREDVGQLEGLVEELNASCLARSRDNVERGDCIFDRNAIEYICQQKRSRFVFHEEEGEGEDVDRKEILQRMDING